MSNLKKILLIVIIASAIGWCVFQLPYLIEPGELVVSPALDYGFNNRVAMLAIIVFLVVITLLRLWQPASEKSNLLNSQEEKKIPLKHLIIAWISYLAIIAALFFLTTEVKRYAEAGYFFDKIDRILLGQRPYLDFEYAYGIIFLYLPIWLKSYHLAYALVSILGLSSVYYLVNQFDMPVKRKLVVFYFLIIAAYPISLGFNYTLLRFIAPYVSLFLARKIITQPKWLLFPGLIGLLLLNISISPEVGIVFAISLALYLLLSSRKIVLGLYLASLAALVLLMPADLALTLRSFGRGGMNWPVVPAPAILIYLLSLLGIGSAILAGYLRERKDHLLAAIVLTTILMMPGAIGRCDPGHVFYYGIGLFIVSFAYLAQNRVRLFRFYSISFLAIFCLGMNISNFNKEELGKIVFRKIEPHYSQKELINLSSQFSKITGLNSDYLAGKIESFYLNKKILDTGALAKYRKIATPFFVDERIYNYLLESDKYVPEYYHGLTLVITKGQISRKLQELSSASHRIIMLRKTDLAVAGPAYEAQGVISALFLYPYKRRVKRNTRELYSGIFDYIRENYYPIEEIGTYLIMERQG